MKRSTEDDHFDWSGALERSAATVRDLNPRPLRLVRTCLCGSIDERGRILAEPVDLANEDVTVARCEGIQRCRGCQHAIHHDAMCVTTYMTNSSVVRDRYHPECVEM